MLFNSEDFSKDDRQFFAAGPNGPANALTLGKYSYVLDVRINWPDKKAHILIGRFCSVSREILILPGANHHFRRTATTFPFFSKEFLMRMQTDVYGGGDTGGLENLENLEAEAFRDNRHQIIVGNDVWIGRRATILGGVKIGNGAIVGAGTIVTKDVPPYAIVGGNPARVIKYRFAPEAIKKFQAVKWWNWDLEKLLKNLPMMDDAEKFLAAHYSPELENIPEDETGREVRNFREQGRDVYIFVADFRALHPLWKKTIEKFFSSQLQNAVLYVFMPKETTPDDVNELKNFAAPLVDRNPSLTLFAKFFGEKNFSPSALLNATHFLTTREPVSSECFDVAFGTGVKVLSALDEEIFTP